MVRSNSGGNDAKNLGFTSLMVGGFLAVAAFANQANASRWKECYLRAFSPTRAQMSSLSIAAGIVTAIAAVGMVATVGTAAASVTAAASREMCEGS